MVTTHCLYCQKEPEREWYSLWDKSFQHHYQTIRCTNCRRKNWHRLSYPGSGHVQNEFTIDSILKKVQEG